MTIDMASSAAAVRPRAIPRRQQPHFNAPSRPTPTPSPSAMRPAPLLKVFVAVSTLAVALSLSLALPLLLQSSHAISSPPSEEKEGQFDESAKYFHEVGGSLALSHYDVRFFAGEVSYADHRLVLRGLIRSYLAAMAAARVETWLAHGTLLGWWWNGRSMPWDYDLDVQVAHGTMAWLGEHMNGTRHRDGLHGEYVLDVSPHHADMKDRAGANMIDARWIDVKTGMFIDITALRERNPLRPGVWSCKNHHRYDTLDLWPLRDTEFEGVPAKVPHAFEQILVQEYGDQCLVVEEFEQHRWDKDIQEWVMKTDEESQRVRALAVERKKQDLKREGRL